MKWFFIGLVFGGGKIRRRWEKREQLGVRRREEINLQTTEFKPVRGFLNQSFVLQSIRLNQAAINVYVLGQLSGKN
jgi:hypothetical protein